MALCAVPSQGGQVASTSIARLRPRQYPLALLGLVLLWPALVNGGPFLFPDTTAYIRAIDAALVKTTGHHTAWSNDDVLLVAGASPSTRPPAAATPIAGTSRGDAASHPVEAKPVLLGRSIFYGALAFTGVLLGSLWIAVALQAVLAGMVVVMAARHVVPSSDQRFARTVAFWMVALATTPLAWFVSMVMPDFLTGLGIVAAAVLVTGWESETRGGRLFWFAIAAFAALAHSSHVLILLALAVLGLAVGLVRIPAWRPGAAALGTAALLGLAGESVFIMTVTRATNAAPIRPPFLTARLVDDGPGTAYLTARCPQAGFALCRYRDRLPMASDTFLWGDQGKVGVFKTLPVAEQRALAAEQGAFARAVVLDRPVAVLSSSLDAAGRQFGAWQLSEFNYAAGDAARLIDHVPAHERTELLASRALRRTMPTTLAELPILPWSLAGLVAIGLACWRGATGPAWFGIALAIGWILNTVLCGALSTPHDRYQARVIWVLALAALAIAAALRRGRMGSNHAAYSRSKGRASARFPRAVP